MIQLIICFQLEFCLEFSPLLVLCCSWPLPFCALQSPGNPTRCEWQTRRPWEAVSPSSSALSLLLLRPTSLLCHGKKTQFRWAQVWPLILCVMDECMHRCVVLSMERFSCESSAVTCSLLSELHSTTRPCALAHWRMLIAVMLNHSPVNTPTPFWVQWGVK